jgi:Alpha amylase, catalytic domain/Carbohydrate-binding module 48 (Isoamylase N-terminal domain)/Secretion system C-terminal sorting domain
MKASGPINIYGKMKKLYIITGLLLFSFSIRAQELESSPAFPLDTSSVSITVDCSFGNQGLLNYSNTSDVYVHVGVITSLSTGSTDWRYVPFTWGTTNPAAQATSLGNNKYVYTISNIRSFFAVPVSEQIIAVAILFRNGNGSLVQRNSDGSDMYQQVYMANGLFVQFNQPPFQPTYNSIPVPITKNVGDSLAIKFISSHTAALNLYFNNVLVNSTASGDSLTAKVPIAVTGNQWVKGTANDGVNNAIDSFNFYVGEASNILPLPTGVNEGINYLPGDTSVTLVLFAPQKNKVVVVGDFNNWTQGTTYQMNKTPDSNYYWLQINGLTAGTEYAYQYVIDDTLILADYNTEKVLDKNVDPGIPSATYPNLKTFPSGASGTLASIIQTAQPAYNWQTSNFKRPSKESLMIYELWLADFTTAGNWQGLMDTLSYLKHLGINAIEIEPFNNFEGSVSWGYNPNFYFAPDKVYGTATAVKQFVDACHQQGIAVIMDLVMNHSFGSSPMVQMYWNNALGVPAANNPWFNQYPTHAFNVGFQFNHESQPTINFTNRVINYWLTNYHIDGYRWDLAKGFTQTNTCDAFGNNCNVSAWGNYDAGRVATWENIYNQMQTTSPGSYCILEMFADNNEQSVEANYGMMLWGANLNPNYNQATMGYNTVSPGGATWDLTGSIYTSLGGWNNPGLIVYQESHDEERLMYNNENYGNSSGTYAVKDTATGLLRNAAAAAFWALAPGPKMLTEFGELGYDYSINWCTNGTVDPSGSCRLTPKPIRWDYLQNSARKSLHDVYDSMMKLRTNYPELDTANSVYSLNGAFKYLMALGSKTGAVVIGNFDVNLSTGTVPFPSKGTWYNYFGTDSVQVTGNQNFTLAAGEYRVYLNTKMIDTTGHDTTVVSSVALAVKIYPNPVVNNSSMIEYDLPEAGTCSLSVISSLGQTMGTVNLGQQVKGKHLITPWQVGVNLSSFANGVYIIKMVSSHGTVNSKFLVVH